jgi:hypothetical protein
VKVVSKRIALVCWLVTIQLLSACGGLRTVDPVRETAVARQGLLVGTSAAPAPVIPTLVPTATPTAPAPTATFTPTPTPAPLRFAVIGDYGEGNQGELDVATMVKGWNPDFIITVGDNNYPSGAVETIDDRIGKYYGEYIAPYSGAYGPGAPVNRFFPTLGNHDLDTAGGQAYLDYFTLPGNERYYDFVVGPVHFFALNSDSREPDGVSSNSTQAQWLQAGLASSTTPWQIVYFHTAPYSSGYHGPVTWMRWPFTAWGADAILAGHEHVYERLLVDGIPYFTNGLGGGPIYYFTTADPQSQVRYADDYGAMLVVIDAVQGTFQFMNRTGQVIDTYTITR